MFHLILHSQRVAAGWPPNGKCYSRVPCSMFMSLSIVLAVIKMTSIDDSSTAMHVCHAFMSIVIALLHLLCVCRQKLINEKYIIITSYFVDLFRKITENKIPLI